MHDNFDDIDRQFRSMLEDAEVKAPRRVWRAVSSRLDEEAALAAAAASRPASPSFPAPWRWGLALAAAAAIALAVVLPGTLKTSSPAAPAIALVDSPADASSDALALAGPAAEPGQSAASVPSAPVRASKPVAKAQPAVGSQSAVPASKSGEAAVETQTSIQPIEETVQPSGASSSESVGDSAPAVQPAATAAMNSASSSAASAPSVPENVHDYWAAVESSEPVSQSHRPSLSFGGMVGTNDSGLAANHGRSMMSPSYGGQQKLNGLSETSSSTYGVPVTFGLGVRFPVAGRLSLGTGVNWSLLTRTFSGDYAEGGKLTKGDVTHQIQYLGVPVNVFFDIVDISTLKFYTYAGGEISHAVSNKYLIRDISKTISNPVDRFQFSVSAGLGIEFPLSGKLGLYLDPGVRYYFYSGQPKSLRTEKPFMVSVDAGLRFDL